MNYLSKKNNNQYFFVDKRTLSKDLYLFKRKTKNKLKMRNKVKKWWNKNINKIDHNCTIVKQKNKYYLCLSLDKKIKNIEPKESYVSLDPGVRTFQTFYGEKTYGEIGKNTDKEMKKIKDISNKIETLQSIATIKSTMVRKRIMAKCSGLRTKIQNKINDLHWQTASYLVKNFATIIIPKFESSKMVSRKTRNINGKTSNNMNILSHYRFRERLEYLVTTVKDRRIIVCGEEYTTKTCGKCGSINDSIKSKKTFKCSKCNLVIDRDINGARNILIKYLGDQLMIYEK